MDFRKKYRKFEKMCASHSFAQKKLKLITMLIVFLCALFAIYRLDLSSVIFVSLVNLQQNYVRIIIVAFVIGVFLANILTNTGADPEIQWLLTLPITYRSIATVKADAIINKILTISIYVGACFIPWRVMSSELLHWLASIVTIILSINLGFASGIICVFSFYIVTKKIYMVYVSSAIIVVICTILTTLIAHTTIDLIMLMTIICILTIFYILARKLLYVCFEKFLYSINQSTNNIQKNSSASYNHIGLERKPRSFVSAIIHKELLYYKYEYRYILQTVMFVLLLSYFISYLSNENEKANLATYVMLYSIPFNLCAQVALFSFGSEYSLIQTIYIVKKKLRGYYFAKTLLPFLIYLLPVIAIYFVFLLLTGISFSLLTITLLVALLLYYSAFSTATSCVFMKVDKNNTVLSKGVRIPGMILYFVLGLALPLLFAFIEMSMLNLFPIVFVFYLVIQLTYSIVLAIRAPYQIQKRITSL